MELKQIEAFLMIVEKGSFSAAANELFITQPTISVRVQQLEQELNTTLFKRINGQKIVLTDDGEKILPYFKEAMEQITAGAKIVGKKIYEEKTIKISCPNHMGAEILPELLNVLYTHFPETDFPVTIEVTKDILAKAKQNDIDVALVYLPKEGQDIIMDNKDYITVPVCQSKTILVSSPDYHLAKEKVISIDMLKDERIFIYDRKFITTRIIEDYIKEQGLASYEPIEINNLGWIKMMVRKGLGISFLQKITVKDEIAMKNLVELPLKQEIPPTPIYLIMKANLNSEMQKTIIQVTKKLFDVYSTHSINL
ncbi:LysR family transcriptional regulator [Bacillus sp. Marseille-P3661]|uniref:LysR family transcriptional regulator n=1 Tax=Bacillus sp. Marseille-P3661 TaxID=1936234 RepID=UPI000C859036|nr:LysR family transcriptional regulator [Bacillus sp. Marseille-P3661]